MFATKQLRIIKLFVMFVFLFYFLFFFIFSCGKEAAEKTVEQGFPDYILVDESLSVSAISINFPPGATSAFPGSQLSVDASLSCPAFPISVSIYMLIDTIQIEVFPESITCYGEMVANLTAVIPSDITPGTHLITFQFHGINTFASQSTSFVQVQMKLDVISSPGVLFRYTGLKELGFLPQNLIVADTFLDGDKFYVFVVSETSVSVYEFFPEYVSWNGPLASYNISITSVYSSPDSVKTYVINTGSGKFLFLLTKDDTYVFFYSGGKFSLVGSLGNTFSPSYHFPLGGNHYFISSGCLDVYVSDTIKIERIALPNEISCDTFLQAGEKLFILYPKNYFVLPDKIFQNDLTHLGNTHDQYIVEKLSADVVELYIRDFGSDKLIFKGLRGVFRIIKDNQVVREGGGYIVDIFHVSPSPVSVQYLTSITLSFILEAQGYSGGSVFFVPLHVKTSPSYSPHLYPLIVFVEYPSYTTFYLLRGTAIEQLGTGVSGRHFIIDGDVEDSTLLIITDGREATGKLILGEDIFSFRSEFFGEPISFIFSGSKLTLFSMSSSRILVYTFSVSKEKGLLEGRLFSSVSHRVEGFKLFTIQDIVLGFFTDSAGCWVRGLCFGSEFMFVKAGDMWFEQKYFEHNVPTFQYLLDIWLYRDIPYVFIQDIGGIRVLSMVN